ncbi:thiolase C-terminal domain-containing protein [Algibacillus agarilyticus]|uniref:thiolase C-terminal domain-containing protein n=1 Tax=Algibacillus agarilyticus TaxID=2234133 RepID=UPI0018E56409|nr:beta-ketoacyl synthase N-terminal-like domain-containing protein [Algibacillus agarilyticus]
MGNKDVFILGVGMTPVGKRKEMCVGEMGSESIGIALESIGLESKKISALYAGNMMAGQLCQQQLVATKIANFAGLSGVEAFTAEGACASGAAAARIGYMSVASGCHDVVAVCGVEKMTHADRESTTKALATASHRETEGSQGSTFLSLNADLMQNYMSTYNVDADRFSGFSVNAHKNALTNPNAMLRKPVCKADYTISRMLIAPLRLLDAPPICDGAATILLGNADMARYCQLQGHHVVKILASTVACDELALSNRRSPVQLASAELSFKRAYKISGISFKDVDIFEPHDAYTVMTALSIEAAGFAEKGEGTDYAQSNQISLQGQLPICTFGGLKARGHPVGATGIYQLAECFLQLTDNAGCNQVRNAGIALAQNFSGAASVAFTHVLESC